MTETTPEKKTLASLMNKVFDVEQELISISDDEMKQLFGDLKGKVDSIKEYLLRLDEYEERVSEKIKSLQEYKKTIQNKSTSLKKYVKYVMETQETDELYGHDYVVKLQRRESLKVKNIEITSDHYLNLNDGLDKQIVKREYSFDATQLKAAYKRDPDKFKDFVEVGTSVFPQFYIKKEV